MADAIAHRGPDDAGVWADKDASIGFGHRRLAILDLSPEGHQPMRSATGRFEIVFNGEIFNFKSIRDSLQSRGHRFRGSGDTEVMLASFEEWGVFESCKKFVGMFAFAVWDRENKTLSLARDRLGIKPLFYSWNSRNFLFASELKALRAQENFHARINANALGLFMRFGFIPAPQSIYSDTFKLSPGCVLELNASEMRAIPAGFSPEGLAAFPSKQLRQFWSLRDVALLSRQREFKLDDNEAIDELERLLTESVRLRMISDVPLGAFLSGGIDSSLVVALMQKNHSTKVRTFSIGFESPAYDEAKHAAAVSSHLGTEHTELYVSTEDLLETIPHLSDFYDEPFADSSQIPSMLVSELARKHVTVALSGDGGDEVFCGYNRYHWSESVWRAQRIIPRALRTGVSSLFGYVTDSSWQKLLSPLSTKVSRPEERIRKLLAVLPEASWDSVYERLLMSWHTPVDFVFGCERPIELFSGKPRFAKLFSAPERGMFLDQQVYLPDDNLQKVDRASMSVALEVRVPLLDHRVVEFAAGLPLRMKLRDKTSKWLLRQLLYRHVPKNIVERPKMGFSVPLGEWISGPLRPWAEDLLNTGLIRGQGLLRSDPVRKLWDEHLSGNFNRQHELWNVLMFQSWLEKWK